MTQAVRFATNNIFTRDISGAPVAAGSAAMVAHLKAQVDNNWGGVAAVNAHQYNASFYIVGSATPRHRIAFNDAQGKGYVPDGLYNGPAIFVDVPIPANAVPASGTDGNLCLYDPQRDQLWELWMAARRGQQWSATWGGRIDGVSRNLGFFPAPFGATATGISFSGSMITIAEAQAGRIEHAMYLAIMEPASWQRFSWPAQRSDGFSKAPNAIPEGTRLRLDPSLNVDSLRLTPFARMVAKAAQRYGFLVCDKAGAVNVSVESGTPTRLRTGKDPWTQMFGRVPDHAQLANFPWGHLQVLPQNYGR